MKYLLISSQLPSPFAAGGTNQRTRLLLDALIESGRTSFWFLEVHAPESRSDEDRMRLIDRLSSEIDVDEVRFFVNPGLTPRDARCFKLAQLGGLFGIGCSRDLVKVLGYRVNHTIRNQILERVEAGEIQAVIFRYVEAAITCGLFDGLLGKVDIVIDADDWQSAYLKTRLDRRDRQGFRLGDLARRAYLRARLRKMEVLEERVLAAVRTVFVASPTDAGKIGRKSVTLLPNSPTKIDATVIDPLGPSGQIHQLFLIVASFSYPPNIDGCQWFLDNCWPHVLEKLPSAKLRIIGCIPDAIATQWSAVPQTEVLGFVRDLDPHYKECTLVVAPVHWGGGTKIKVLEAFAYGRSVVGTQHSIEGMAVSNPSQFGWFSNNAVEVARGCVELATDHVIRHRLEAAIRDYAMHNFSKREFNRIVCEAVSGHSSFSADRRLNESRRNPDC